MSLGGPVDELNRWRVRLVVMKGVGVGNHGPNEGVPRAVTSNPTINHPNQN